MNKLIATYKTLINETLPQAYQSPVRYNHCFNRIILDWLFGDCWYNHLNRNKTAVSQLSETQLQQAIQRMNAWIESYDLLVVDNQNSLTWRKKTRAVLIEGNGMW